MAITGSLNGNNPAAPTPPQPSGNASTGSTNVKRTGFMSGNMFGAPIGRGVGSEYLNKIADNISTTYKTASSDYEMTVLVMDKANEISLAYSGIIVCTRMRSQANRVAAHIFLVEGTGEKLNSVYENIMGQQVEILRVTSDAFDNTIIKIAKENIAKAFPGSTIYVVDGSVIPSEFDPENKAHSHQLALNAGLAVGTELEIHDANFRDVNIVDVLDNSTLIVDIGFDRKQMDDAYGSPMRSDLLIQFRSQKPGREQNQSVNSYDKDVQLSTISGFIDMLYAPIQQQQMYNPWAPVSPTMNQKFAANLVITNLATSYGYTPGMVLLSLVTAMTINNNGIWIQNFRPMASKSKEVCLFDVGALNIEGNMEANPTGYGVAPDTKSSDFTLEELGKFMGMLVRPGLMISIDVPDCGPQTWYTSVFREAANGNVAAYDVIYNSAMELTNGNFAKHFAKGTPMFEFKDNRVHLGYWTDTSNQRRDIRDIDYLAVSNLSGKKNPEYIRNWSDTFLSQYRPLPTRMNDRKKMIEGMTGMSAVFKGFATRVTFGVAFLQALASSCMEAGLNPVVKTPLTSADFINQRGMATFVNTALLSPGQTFGNNGFAYQTPYQNRNAYHGRYQ